MKLKAMRYLFVIAVALLVVSIFTMVVVDADRWSPPSKVPPPPPTPTTFPPPPTETPPTLDLDHLIVASREQAIDWALYYDSAWAIRDQPLTKEMLAAQPEMIIVEEYATRREANEVYGMGILNESVSPPVWIVIIKGKVSVNMPGLASVGGPMESDGVTYFICKVDGSLIGLSTSIARKRSENSP